MLCPNCNSEVLSTDRFCKVCGASVNVQTNDSPNVDDQTVVTQPKKKRKIWIIGGVVVALVVFVLYFGSDDRNIDSIKGSTLSAYDYGETIGESLNNWFGGTEEWYTMEEGSQLYVCVRGECEYLRDIFEPAQVFIFSIADDSDYFYFEGAYDENGDPIFSNTGNVADSWAMELYDSYLGVNFYEVGIKAAFGDQETLELLQEY